MFSMVPKVVLVARLASGQFVPVEFRKGRPIAPADAKRFYLRYTADRKRRVEPVGCSLDEAAVAFKNRELNFTRLRAGLLPVTEPVLTANAIRLRDAVAEYVETAKTIGNNLNTAAAKQRTLGLFCDVCAKIGILTIDQLRDTATGRRAVLAYMAWLKTELPTTQVEGARTENTRHAMLSRLGAFLKHHGVKLKKDRHAGPADAGLLAHHEFPKYIAKQPTRYSRETIAAILKTATTDEADIIWFFLSTGFRDGEAAHAEWSDINFRDNSINIHAKPQTDARPWSWTPKDDESRPVDIPLSANFVRRMEDRRIRQKNQKGSLIFPNSVGKPNRRLLWEVRNAAKRAGITERIELHKFRKTFACWVAEKHGIELTRRLLGHSNIATTQLYLSANAADVGKLKASVDDMTADFGG
jgi:integrase